MRTTVWFDVMIVILFYSQIFLVSFHISLSSFTIGFLFMNLVRRFFIVAEYVLVLCTHDFCCMNEIRFFIFVTALNARLVFIFADSIILENQINEWMNRMGNLKFWLNSFLFEHLSMDDVSFNVYGIIKSMSAFLKIERIIFGFLNS